jgi:hypothetical protein
MALHSAPKWTLCAREGGADRLSLRRRVQLAADVLAPRYLSRGAASRHASRVACATSSAWVRARQPLNRIDSHQKDESRPGLDLDADEHGP